LEKRAIFVPTTIRTLDHSDGATGAVYTTQLPKYHPKTGHDIQPLPSYNLERNPLPTVLEAG